MKKFYRFLNVPMLIIFICWANVASAATLRVLNSTGHYLDNITVKIRWQVSGYTEYYRSKNQYPWETPNSRDEIFQTLNTNHTFSGTLQDQNYSEKINIGDVSDPPRLKTKYTCWFVEYSYDGVIYQTGVSTTSTDCVNAGAYGYFSFSLNSAVGNVDIKITGFNPNDMEVQVLTGSNTEDNSFKYSVREVRKI